MPLIEFICKECNISFEKIFATRPEYIEGEVECPECQKTKTVSRLFGNLSLAKFVLSKTKRLNLIDKGYKLSKGETPPGLKRLN